MKNLLEGLKSRFKMAEEKNQWTRERFIEIIHWRIKRIKMNKFSRNQTCDFVDIEKPWKIAFPSLWE